MADAMEEKLNPLVEEYRRIISKRKQFYSIECFVYKNFYETRKRDSNTVRVLFLLLNFQKSRKCTLN